MRSLARSHTPVHTLARLLERYWNALPQRRTVPPQPIASGSVIGKNTRDEPPVRGRVVHAAQVHQLVNEDVIPYERRHQNQPPVQANVTIPAARAPPRLLVADGNPCDRQPMPLRQVQQPARQIFTRLLLQRAVVVGFPHLAGSPVPLLCDPLRIPPHECLGLAP